MAYGRGRKRRAGGVRRLVVRNAPSRDECERVLRSLIRIAADLLDGAGELNAVRPEWLDSYGGFPAGESGRHAWRPKRS